MAHSKRDSTSVGVGSPAGSAAQLAEYNYEHFRPKHLLADMWRSVKGDGLRPGSEAPDFELRSTEDAAVRLSSLRGRPVFLHFGSGTWPVTTGAVAPVKKLYDRYGDQIQFLDVIIRQAHPGELRGRYLEYEDKVTSAQEYEQLEGITWPVLVDDYEGTVHRTYSQEMADPSFLIDAEGRIVFYNMWTHAPSLKRAFDEPLSQGGVGAPVAGGIDRVPHMFASLVDGIRGPQRGGKRAVREYTVAAFGAGALSVAGNKAKPVLGPLALRAEPLPAAAQAGLGLLALSSLAAVAAARRSDDRRETRARRRRRLHGGRSYG